MVQLGENTYVRVGLVIAILSVVFSIGGGAIWWASAMETRARKMEEESKETKDILKEISINMRKGMGTVSADVRETSDTLKTLLNKHQIMLERTSVQMEGLKNRVDRIEAMQHKIMKGDK